MDIPPGYFIRKQTEIPTNKGSDNTVYQ